MLPVDTRPTDELTLGVDGILMRCCRLGNVANPAIDTPASAVDAPAECTNASGAP